MSDSSRPCSGSGDRDRSPEPAASGRRTRADEAARRSRLARIFGEVLPDATGDDRDPGWGDRDSCAAGDDWLRGQVPPHHG